MWKLNRCQSKENYQRSRWKLYNKRGLTHKEDIEILNVHTTRPQNRKVYEAEKGKVGKSIITLGGFIIPPWTTNRTPRQKSREDTGEYLHHRRISTEDTIPPSKRTYLTFIEHFP